MSVVCDHLDQIQVVSTDERACVECVHLGDTWVHLRLCLECGHVGCCDSSPNRHASAHARASAHPVVSSVEPGEDWSYCYVDDVAFVLRESG